MLQKNSDEMNKIQDTLCNSEDYKSLVEINKETLERREDIVAEMDELLKPSGDNSIYRGLHRMEGIIANARTEWQEQQLKSRDTSPQKDANEEVAQGTLHKGGDIATRRKRQVRKQGTIDCYTARQKNGRKKVHR